MSILSIMMKEEESINNIGDLSEYMNGYDADPADVYVLEESDAFRAGHYQREIDDDCTF